MSESVNVETIKLFSKWFGTKSITNWFISRVNRVGNGFVQKLVLV